MPIVIWYLKNGFRIFCTDLALLFLTLLIVDDTTMNMKGCYKDQSWKVDILASNGEEIAEKQSCAKEVNTFHGCFLSLITNLPCGVKPSDAKIKADKFSAACFFAAGFQKKKYCVNELPKLQQSFIKQIEIQLTKNCIK